MNADEICDLCPNLSGTQKKCYIYVKSMPLITKLPLMLLKVSKYIYVIWTKITSIY